MSATSLFLTGYLWSCLYRQQLHYKARPCSKMAYKQAV